MPVLVDEVYYNKISQTRCFDNRNLFPTVMEAEKSKIKVLDRFHSNASHVDRPPSHMTFPLCIFVGKRREIGRQKKREGKKEGYGMRERDPKSTLQQAYECKSTL